MLITITTADGNTAGISDDLVAAVVPAVDGADKSGAVPVLGMCVVVFKVPTVPPQVVRESVSGLVKRVNESLRSVVR